MTRIVLFFVFGCIVVMFLVQSRQIGLAQRQMFEQQYMLAAYRYPIGITVNYIKLFLNLGDPLAVQSKIKSLTDLLVQLAADPVMISLLTDQNINLPAIYTPYIVNSANRGLAYDQIDIFYVVYSCLITLSSSSVVNRTGVEYVKLDSYLKQYNRMTNSTKLQLHRQFNSLILETQRYQLWSLVAMVVVFLLTTLFLCYHLHSYYQKRNELITIILQFDHLQTLIHLTYWRTIAAAFAALTSRDPSSSTLHSSTLYSSLGFNTTQHLTTHAPRTSNLP